MSAYYRCVAHQDCREKVAHTVRKKRKSPSFFCTHRHVLEGISAAGNSSVGTWIRYLGAVDRDTSWVPLGAPRGTQEVSTGKDGARCRHGQSPARGNVGRWRRAMYLKQRNMYDPYDKLPPFRHSPTFFRNSTTQMLKEYKKTTYFYRHIGKIAYVCSIKFGQSGQWCSP